MTESIRRGGEYDDPYQGERHAYAQQHASSPANPEWPPPPPPAQSPAGPVAVEPGTTVWPGRAAAPAGGSYGGDGTGDGGGGFGTGGDGGGTGGGTAVIAAPPAGPGAHSAHGAQGAHAAHAASVSPAAPEPAPAPAPRQRTRGPVALLAAVAIVAAAVGGGTAYGIQELTGSDTVAATTSTSVVPAAKKGDIAAIAAAVSPSIVEINATSGSGRSTGSGVIITGDGEILTNNHVVSGASSIKVRTSDGTSYTARVAGTDGSKDLALIKLQGASGLKAAALGDSSGVSVGDTVVAIGSPEGLTGTVTSGIVSALNRDVTVPTAEGQSQGGGNGQWPFEFGGRQFNGDTGSSTTTYKAIQTDASLNPGNSGGALIDMNGTVVGINSAMYSAASESSSSGAGSVGLGFAIPVDTVKSDLATLRAGGSD